MKEIDQELLSRILDEDVSEFETQRILKEMQSDDRLGAKLHRYNVIGHAMRSELPAQINRNFVHNVMAKLADENMLEPEHSLEHSQLSNDVAKQNQEVIEEGSSRFKAAIGFAIAASVAVVSFVSFQNYVQTNTDTAPNALVADRVVEESDIQRVSSEDLQNFISNPKAAASFNSYIMNHAEYASPRVSVPHVRIVGYGKEEIDTNN